MMKRIAAALLLALVLSGCGYALVGRANFLPETLKTIHIPTFENKTTRVELEQIVTRRVAEEFVSRGRLTLVSTPAEADIILNGTITSFGLTPVAFDDQGRATQYQVNVRAQIDLVDKTGEEAEVLWKNDQYYFAEAYRVSPDLLNSFDQETRAIQDIAVRFSESLVSSILEGF